MASELQQLPVGFHTGVTEDGRIFFINDLERTTSWLHPITKEPVLTGLHSDPDLPRGWEAAGTVDGRVYFVDHNRGITTYTPPQPPSQPPHSPQEPISPQSKEEHFKRGTSKQRSVKAPSAKRNPNSEVIKSGWVYRLESSGLSKSWKRRWLVLADFALFVYKDKEESSALSSILLPSYRINPCTEEDQIKRNFVFKVEHENTKTVYLATDDSPELVSWMSLLRQSAMMNGNTGFHREPNNNFRQSPYKDANKDPNSFNPRDIMDSNPNLNSSLQNSTNIRPYTQQNNDPNYGMGNRYSNASQSPSYRGFNDPAASPLASPTEPRPRIGGVYPFTLQQGQRQSYVSQGGSNRNSLAKPSSQTPVNHSQPYSPSNRPDSLPLNPQFDQQPGPQRNHYQQGRYPDGRFPSSHLKDGFEPDSVRSSLAQSDVGRGYQNQPNNYSTQRDQTPQGYRNGSGLQNTEPTQQNWHRDQRPDNYSDSREDGQIKQLHQWDKNLPAMGMDTMKHASFANLLDGVDRPQANTFNSRSKSHEHFSQYPNNRYPNGNQNQGFAPNGNNNNNGHPPNNRPNHEHRASERSSYADNYRGQGYNGPTNGQEFQTSFRPPNEHSHHFRKEESYGPIESGLRDSYDRNSQSSFHQPNRNELVARGAPRPQEDPRSSVSKSSSHLLPHHQSQTETIHPSTSHNLQNSFNSYDRESIPGQFQPNSGQYNPDQRWTDNSFTSLPGRSSYQTDNDPHHHQHQYQKFQEQEFHQEQQNPNQSLRPDMQLDSGNQSDSSYPNPHTYMNLPSRRTHDEQYGPDHQHRLAAPHDLSHNLSHDSSSDQPPARPPYPASVREQIVKEIAQVQTPSTQKDFLISNELNQQRMQQPSYFQYPSPRDQQSRESNQDLDRSIISRVSQRSLEANLPGNMPASRLSSASRASQSSRRDHRDNRPPQQETQPKRDMMDPEAQTMRAAFERVHSLRMSPERAQKRPDGSYRQSQTDVQLEQLDSPVKPPRVLSQAHRAYKSQDELDMVGEMPPPRGSYHKIRDDSEDLYQRGSAFRPPSSMSGSQLGTDSLQRMKKFSNTLPLNIPMDNDERNGSGYSDYQNRRSYDRSNDDSQQTPYDNLNGVWRYQRQGGAGPMSGDEEQFEEGHLFFDPYGTTVKVQQERNMLKLAAPPKRKPLPIHTVKEDPNMPDRDVLETDLQKVAKKNPLNAPRLRMSICAGDLIGKTHDELVLLLIQLRRNQSALEKTRDFYKQQLDQRRSGEMEFRRQMHQFGEVHDGRLHEAHHNYAEAKGQMDEIEKKLEVYRPIINLLDNMVTMGSLYGGDNFMLATQYRKHLLRPDQYQAPRKMLEFSRQHQEDRLIQETNEEIKQLSADEVDLEEKIDRLNVIDRLIQEQSFKVSSFKEDKELMERALNGICRQQDQSGTDQWERRRLTQQQRMLEKEISHVTQQLAEASKQLEETTAENNKLEHEVALLRTKVHGELTRSRSAPSLASESMRTKMKMEKDLAKVQDMMQGLNQQGAKLSQAMNTLRRSSSGTQLASPFDNDENDGASHGTYLQTDLDSGEQIDLAKSGPEESLPATQQFISHQRQNASEPEDWNTDEGDENTRKFFGLGPKDKVKGQTVRDVKRLSEARREKKKDDEDYGEEIKLRVSNVDTEDSSFIQARIASDLKSRPAVQPWDPLYENLPRYGSMPALPGNQSASSSRRSSIILMGPKPFTPYQDKSARPFKSELFLDSTNRANELSQLNSKQNNGLSFNEQYSIDSSLKSDSQDFYVNKIGPENLRSEAQYNGNYMSQQDQSQLSSPYSNGQFHAKPLTIQPSNLDNRIESPITQDFTDSFQEAQRSKMSAYEGNLSQTAPINGDQIRPWEKLGTDSHFKLKKNPRGRHLTISSSQPFQMETNSLLSPTLHSSAGDLILNRSIDDVPDIVKSSQTQVDQIDEDTIDREILYVPDKVLIPERYDAEADAEQLTEEDQMRRLERAERIKRVLASQSVLSMSQPDVSHLPSTDFHDRVETEKKERAHFLALNQELARQVTLQSKKQAAERRKTWSGAQFADAKKLYEEELLNSSALPLRSPDVHKKRAEITLREI